MGSNSMGHSVTVSPAPTATPPTISAKTTTETPMNTTKSPTKTTNSSTKFTTKITSNTTNTTISPKSEPTPAIASSSSSLPTVPSKHSDISQSFISSTPPCPHRPHAHDSRTTSLASTPPTSVSAPASRDVGFVRASKRTSSSSNDLLYERDRFRARLHNLNSSHDPSPHQDDPPSSYSPPKSSSTSLPSMSEVEKPCDVCDRIELKTTKLNIKSNDTKFILKDDTETDISDLLNDPDSPLSPSSVFYKTLKDSSINTNHLNIVIKSLDFAQLKLVFDWYFNKPLPATSQMFPWLHGLNTDNFAQKQFFLYQQHQLQSNTNVPLGDLYNIEKPKDIRFLMCINADEYNKEPQNPVVFNSNLSDSKTLFMETKRKKTYVLKNTLKLSEILRRIDVSRLEIANIISEIFLTTFHTPISSDVLELFKQDCININHLPIFLNLDPDRGVSLRNFHIQVAKLATCSDFLVYGSSNEDSKTTMESCARLLWLAQRYEASQTSNPAEYNVFVTNESLGILANSPSESIKSLSKTESKIIYDKYDDPSTTRSASGIDVDIPNSKLFWANDYQIKEKIETTRMSSATQISKNVWIGNYWDYQIMMTYLNEGSTSYLKHYNEQQESFNTKDQALKHLYCDPKNSIVMLKPTNDSSLLNYLNLPKANWRLFVYCHNGGAFPDLSTLSALLFKFSLSDHRMHKDSGEPEYAVLEFPPSGSVGIGDCKKDNLVSIVNTCKLIYLYSSSTSEDSDVLSSLIFCSDGYTESSLLVLCYLMYLHNISHQDAMLKLHLDYGRPFYIFNSDVTILKKLSVLLRKFSPANPANKGKIDWSSLEVLTNAEINDTLLSPSSTKLSNSVRLGYIDDEENYDDDTSSSSSSSSDESDVESNSPEAEWVKDVEGSIPSRVLPYLYLGSLKHANCLPLLNKLGIKKIISVGEQLDWLNGYKFQTNNDIMVDEIDNGNIEVYSISPSVAGSDNKYKHHHSYQCSIDSVMKVNNLQDDGIDDLSCSLPSMLKYIDDEYKRTNGNTKILVHCRVGVSRSATVVIAEVMRRLNVTLPNAYLFVRVRRLNIIIQPNLRFMYELFKWEEQEKARKEKEGLSQQHLREIDWFMMCREIMKLNLPYLGN